MMRAAVIGSEGQLGSDLVKTFERTGRYKIFPLCHEEMDCAETDSVRKTMTDIRPEVVVNCAAFVRVDECEDRADEAFRVNAIGAFNVARTCADLGALCVYISTDYVFDGEKDSPYTEEDAPFPINAYGVSKLAGEYMVSQACPKRLIVRTASLFGRAGARGKGGNFVETILDKARKGDALRVVNDIRMSPTYTCDAACALERLIAQGAEGIFHVANGGSCTWYEFAGKALELTGIRAVLEPVSSSEYPTRARRPKNSSLRSARLSEYTPRPWEEALKAYLAEKAYIAS